jgi:hypothetical protein
VEEEAEAAEEEKIRLPDINNNKRLPLSSNHLTVKKDHNLC